jgi:hypothetical protein
VIVQNIGPVKICKGLCQVGHTAPDRRTQKTICADLLVQHKDDGGWFLSHLMMGEKTWLHYFEHQTRRQSMKQHHENSPRKKKFKAVHSTGKNMTIFWDQEQLLLMSTMRRGATINSELYMNVLKTLHSRMQSVQPYWQISDFCCYMAMPGCTSDCKPQRC